MSAKLQVISGPKRDTYTLGYIISGRAFRDPRFGPALQYFEATWLLRNERALQNRDRHNWEALP